MTDGIPNTEGSNFSVSGYAQANAGVVNNAANETYLNIGATLGGKLDYKGTYLKGEVGAGTALSASLEAGHEFDIGKNMGLNLSANAQVSRSVNSRSLSNVEPVKIPNSSIEFDIETNSRWVPNESKLGLGAELTFGSDKAKFGVGIEGGIRRYNNGDNITPEQYEVTESKYECSNGVQTEIVNTYKGYSTFTKTMNDSKAYLTPKISADVKLNEKVSFVLNADLHHGNAGIRYKF